MNYFHCLLLATEAEPLVKFIITSIEIWEGAKWTAHLSTLLGLPKPLLDPPLDEHSAGSMNIRI